MKKSLVCLLILTGLSLCVAGCTPKEKEKDSPATDQPKTEQPAQPEAPKDHPAH